MADVFRSLSASTFYLNILRSFNILSYFIYYFYYGSSIAFSVATAIDMFCSVGHIRYLL